MKDASSLRKIMAGVIGLFLLLVVLGIVAATLIPSDARPFKIPTGNMKPTLLVGDHLFTKNYPRGSLPQLGDVIVFRFPTENAKEEHCGSVQYDKPFLKRVVGLPGDEIQVRDEVIYRNGVKVGPEPYTRILPDVFREKDPHQMPHKQYQHLWESQQLDSYVMGKFIRDDFGPVRVPAGSYFVMGDNRDESCDSRFWGAVPDNYVRGKAWLIYWPLNRIGVIH